MTYEELVEHLYDLDRVELRTLAYEALLRSDGPDHISGDVQKAAVDVARVEYGIGMRQKFRDTPKRGTIYFSLYLVDKDKWSQTEPMLEDIGNVPRHWIVQRAGVRFTACGKTIGPTMVGTPNLSEATCMSCMNTTRYKNALRDQRRQ